VLAPWLKFVWESYKQCLDLLKNNNRVEKIYQEVAQMGFHFCQKYNRRPEFRKLCDTIRTHFTQSQKYSQQTYGVNIQLPETQVLHLETRLIQLDTAIAMELWQEAFKAVEDIHTFTTISKKTPKPQQLASYYNKVALVFWKAGNYVFHATTVLKLYVLHKEQKKNITHAELSRLSTKACKIFFSLSGFRKFLDVMYRTKSLLIGPRIFSASGYPLFNISCFSIIDSFNSITNTTNTN